MQNNSGNPIRQINPPELGKPPGYSQVVDVRAGRIIFIAGQTALNEDGKLVGKSNFLRKQSRFSKTWARHFGRWVAQRRI